MTALDNRDVLRDLIGRGGVDVRPSPLLWQRIDAHPVSFDRVEGMLLGLAIGDALGNPTEPLLPRTRAERHGEIRDYLPTRHGRAVPSDDTQLAFWTLEHLLRHGALVPEALAQDFANREIFGIGQTVRAFVAVIHAGEPWYAAGPSSAGNGALMRIAPVLVPHLPHGGALHADAALAAMLTHNDSASISACLAFVSILWQALALEQPPQPTWWIDEYVRAARAFETERSYLSRSPHVDYEGTLSGFVDSEVRRAVDDRVEARVACDRWYSGAFLLETVPSVLQILALHAHDPEEAIVRAVNDTRDNDTVAAIVGAAVGALHGRQSLPARWLSELSGRTGASDDGRVFELVAAARERFTP